MNVYTMHGEACPRSNVGGYAHFGDASDTGFGFKIGVPKFVKKVGHAIGKVASSKVVKGVLAGGLALTGVGTVASAAILGGVGATGGALRKGGGLKAAVKGGAGGAALGVAAGVAGKVLPKVPFLGKKVMSLRKITSARLPKKIAPKINPDSPAIAPETTGDIVSYDSDNRLDALSTALPAVGITGGAIAQPVLRTIGGRVRTKRKLFDVLKDQAKEIAVEKAVDLASGVTTPPSANPSAPQGGFPATPATLSPENQNQDSETGAPVQMGAGGFGELLQSPIGLLAIGAVAYTMFGNKRGRR